MSRREFYIETPIGKLKVYAKHPDGDCEQDYPGVFIEWVDGDKSFGETLCCVEYDSSTGIMITSVYEPYEDKPLGIIKYHGCCTTYEGFI